MLQSTLSVICANCQDFLPVFAGLIAVYCHYNGRPWWVFFCCFFLNTFFLMSLEVSGWQVLTPECND